MVDTHWKFIFKKSHPDLSAPSEVTGTTSLTSTSIFWISSSPSSLSLSRFGSSAIAGDSWKYCLIIYSSIFHYLKFLFSPARNPTWRSSFSCYLRLQIQVPQLFQFPGFHFRYHFPLSSSLEFLDQGFLPLSSVPELRRFWNLYICSKYDF